MEKNVLLLRTLCKKTRDRAGVKLWSIPPRSVDLNAVERFWAWLRKKLRSMDLADAGAKRPLLGKMAYRARTVRGLKTKRAQEVAINIARGYKRTCKSIIAAKGAAVKG